MGNFFDGYTASFCRSILVVSLLTPLALKYRQLESLSLKKTWKFLAGMLAASLFTWGPLYYAILHAGVGISLAIAYASIVLGMFFFGWLLAGERFTKNKAISATLGIIGLALIFSPTTGKLGWLALIAALVSGLSSAANSVLAKRIPYNATQSTIMLWMASIVANFIMAAAFSGSYPVIAWRIQWLYLVIFAISSVIASWTFVRGVKLIDAGAAGILGLLEIVFGVLIGIIFFHERPSLVAITGMLIIIVAADIPYVNHYKSQTEH